MNDNILRERVVCPKCGHDDFHSPFGCLHGKGCDCGLDNEQVEYAILKLQIDILKIKLETQQQFLHNVFAGHYVGPMKECKVCQDVLKLGD
jgi:hypothetical protein